MKPANMSATTPAQELEQLHELEKLIPWLKGLVNEDGDGGSIEMPIRDVATLLNEIERLRDARAAVIEECIQAVRMSACKHADESIDIGCVLQLIESLKALRALANRSALPSSG